MTVKCQQSLSEMFKSQPSDGCTVDCISHEVWSVIRHKQTIVAKAAVWFKEDMTKFTYKSTALCFSNGERTWKLILWKHRNYFIYQMYHKNVCSNEFASVVSLQRMPCFVLRVRIKPWGRTTCWAGA